MNLHIQSVPHSATEVLLPELSPELLPNVELSGHYDHMHVHPLHAKTQWRRLDEIDEENEDREDFHVFHMPTVSKDIKNGTHITKDQGLCIITNCSPNEEIIINNKNFQWY